MKIIKHGYTKNVLTCPACQCVFEVDSMDDFKVSEKLIFSETVQHQVKEYRVSCPECYIWVLSGYNLDEIPSDINLMHPLTITRFIRNIKEENGGR